MLNHAHFEDGSEVQEAQIGRVEFVEPREEAPAALESPEQPLDLVPTLVGFPVVLPFDFPVRLRRHDRRHPEVADELAGSRRLRRRGPSPEARPRPDRPSSSAGRGLRARRGPARRTGGKSLPAGRLRRPCGSSRTIRRAICRCFAARSSSAPRCRRMHLDAGAVEAEADRVPAGRMQFPQRGEQPLEHAAARPAAELGVDRASFSEPLRQGAPFAAVLQDVQDRIDEDGVRNPHVPALNRQERADFGVLFCCDLFHDCAPLDFYVIVDSHLSMEPSKSQAKF